MGKRLDESEWSLADIWVKGGGVAGNPFTPFDGKSVSVSPEFQGIPSYYYINFIWLKAVQE